MKILRTLTCLAAVVAALAGRPAPASAACGALPFLFTNGVSPVSATTTNANNNYLVACAQNVDNTQIGTAGIYASQIIPTTVGQATFGGTTVGYSFGGYPSSVVPLSIFGVTSQSVDILDVLLTSGGTKEVWVTSAGVFTTALATTTAGSIFSAAAVPGGSNVYVANDNGATNGLQLNVPMSSTNGFTFSVNGGSVASISNAGVGTTAGSIFSAHAVPAGTNVYTANDNGGTNGLQFNVPTGSTNGFTFSVNNVSKATISNSGAGSFVGVAAGGAITTATTINASGIITGQQFSGQFSPRVQSVSSASTVTPSADGNDMVVITAQAAGLTLANPSPATNITQGQKLIIRIKDNGTPQTIAYGGQYRASSDLALPTTTIASKTLYMGFIWNSTDSKWDMLALLNNF